MMYSLFDEDSVNSVRIQICFNCRTPECATGVRLFAGDPFAIYEVILKLQHEMSSLEFQNLITSNKSALSYYMKYLRHWNRDQLFRMYGLNEDTLNQGWLIACLLGYLSPKTFYGIIISGKYFC